MDHLIMFVLTTVSVLAGDTSSITIYDAFYMPCLHHIDIVLVHI